MGWLLDDARDLLKHLKAPMQLLLAGGLAVARSVAVIAGRLRNDATRSATQELNLRGSEAVACSFFLGSALALGLFFTPIGAWSEIPLLIKVGLGMATGWLGVRLGLLVWTTASRQHGGMHGVKKAMAISALAGGVISGMLAILLTPLAICALLTWVLIVQAILREFGPLGFMHARGRNRGLGAVADVAYHFAAISFPWTALLSQYAGYSCARCGQWRADVEARIPDGTLIPTWPSIEEPLFRQIGGTPRPLVSVLETWLANPDAEGLDLASANCPWQPCSLRENRKRTRSKRVLVLAQSVSVVERELWPALARIGGGTRIDRETVKLQQGAGWRVTLSRAERPDGAPGQQLSVHVLLAADGRFARPSVLGYDRCLVLHAGAASYQAFRVRPAEAVDSLIAMVSAPEHEDHGEVLTPRSKGYLFLSYLFTDTPRQPADHVTTAMDVRFFVYPAVEGIGTVPKRFQLETPASIDAVFKDLLPSVAAQPSPLTPSAPRAAE
jgi:hypothetical protein